MRDKSALSDEGSHSNHAPQTHRGSARQLPYRQACRQDCTAADRRVPAAEPIVDKTTTSIAVRAVASPWWSSSLAEVAHAAA